MTAQGTRQNPAWRLLVIAARLLFWAYVATLLVAGLWGIAGARLDFPILLRQRVSGLSPTGAADVLSQYRFLRGIEAGFALFAVVWWRQVFTARSSANRVFLSTMALGILGRLVGLAADGTPTWPMYVFLAGELAGLACITAVAPPWPSRQDLAPRGRARR